MQTVGQISWKSSSSKQLGCIPISTAIKQSEFLESVIHFTVDHCVLHPHCAIESKQNSTGAIVYCLCDPFSIHADIAIDQSINISLDISNKRPRVDSVTGGVPSSYLIEADMVCRPSTTNTVTPGTSIAYWPLSASAALSIYSTKRLDYYELPLLKSQIQSAYLILSFSRLFSPSFSTSLILSRIWTLSNLSRLRLQARKQYPPPPSPRGVRLFELEQSIKVRLQSTKWNNFSCEMNLFDTYYWVGRTCWPYSHRSISSG